MPLSFIQYPANGSTDTYNIPFAYLSKSHIQVKVNGVIDSAVTFPTDSTVKTSTVPPNGVVVEIRRITPNGLRLVDFADGSLLGEGDLDRSALQVFYVMQEVVDDLVNRMGVTSTNVWDAFNKRITNVANGVNPTDAVNVQQTLTIVSDASTARSAAEAARDQAQLSATNAATSAINSANSASSASTSATTATTQSSNASTSATNAATSATQAANSAASVNLRTIVSISGNYTVVATDRNKLVDYVGSGGHTISFTAAATLGSGFEFHIKNSGTGNVTVDPSGSETIDGSTTLVLTPNQAIVVVCTGTTFKVSQARGYGAGTGTVTQVNTGAGLKGGPINNSGTVDLDLNTLTTATPANNDFLAFADVSDANNVRKATVTDVLALQTGRAPDSASFITASSEASLTAERTFVAGHELFSVDKGAGNGFYVAFFPNPSQYLWFKDDFTEGDGDGDLNWSYTTTGSPPQPGSITGEPNAPGIVTHFTGSTTTGGIFRHRGINSFKLGGGEIHLETRVRFPILSDATQEYAYFFGFGNANAAIPSNGVFFGYNRAVDGNFWSINTVNNSVATKTVLATAVSNFVWYKLKIIINAAATNVDFYLNGSLVGSITTNIPTGSGRECGPGMSIKKSVGTAPRSMEHDYCWLWHQLSPSR
jgi:hypothetical protein